MLGCRFSSTGFAWTKRNAKSGGTRGKVMPMFSGRYCHAEQSVQAEKVHSRKDEAFYGNIYKPLYTRSKMECDCRGGSLTCYSNVGQIQWGR